jgi:hypothetical protein
MTEGERRIIQNLKNKMESAEKMFENLVREMNDSIRLEKKNDHTKTMEVPSWL